MKKTLLTGIAALLLATGAAHASIYPVDFQCGDIRIRIQTFSATKRYSIFIDSIPSHENTETTTLSWDDTTPILNGVRCKSIDDKEDEYDMDQGVRDMLEKR